MAAARYDSSLEQHKGRANGGMSREGRFLRWRKYAHASRAVRSRCRKHKRGFGQIQLDKGSVVKTFTTA